MEAAAELGFDARAGTSRRDQLQTPADADGLPVTYQPFKFESRRSRIDWRLLHSVDINRLIRDTDLDTLERLVGCLAWGDIEAEDSRHLAESSFVKVFRLAQLLLEYLLYVQDSLKHTNNVLELSRSRSLQHMHALNSRCRELQGQLKKCKQELRRARKTVKTLELVATAVSNGAAAAATTAPAAATAHAAASGSAVNVTMQAAAHEQQQQQPVPVVLPGSQHVLTVQQQGGSLMYMTAGELLLQSQMTELTERLAVAGGEAEQLRQEREELCYQVRHLHDMLAAKTDGIKSSQRHFSPGRSSMLGSRPGTGSPTRQSAAGAAAATAQLQQQQQQHQEEQQLLLMEVGKLEVQLQQTQTENTELRQQLMQKSTVDFTATNEVTASLQAQLDGKIRELLQLQSDLRQSETSMAVFKQANETLKQQLDALQKQLNSPEAATPSFVAKQRTRLAAAETKAQKAETQAQQLQVENMQLAKQIEMLQAQLLAAGMQPDMLPNSGVSEKAAVLGEDSVVAAAEELLSGRSTPAAAAAGNAMAAQPSSSLQQQQQELTNVSAEWKLAEIERLQEDNRLLQAKVTSLQEQLHDLERLNAQLERQAAKARHMGLAASLESGGRSGTPSPLGQQHHLAAAVARWAGGSVNSSGPREELTAADLAAARGSGPASPGNDCEDDEADEQGQQGAKEEAEHADEPLGISVRPAATAAGGDGCDRSSSPAGLVKGLLQRFSSKGKAQLSKPVEASDSATAADSTLIPAFRPQEPAATAELPEPQTAGVKHDGAISRDAAQQLKALVAAMAEKPAEQLAADHAEALIDWETPYKLEPEEDAQFGALLPLQMPGRPGLLMAAQHDPQELAANQGRLLASINRQLDAQVASFGIHPGRTGLSKQEVAAAMNMLSERRQALEASLPEEQGGRVDMMRVGLIFNCWNTLQGALQEQPPGTDGKRHLQGPVAPLLVSGVQPPASMLPVGPPSVRVAAGAGVHSMAGALGNRGTLQSSFTNAASPAASSRYYAASAAQDSEDEAHSPQPHPYYSSPAAPGSGNRPDTAVALLQATSPRSPLSAGPLSSGPAGMAGSHVTSRAASYTAATYRPGAAGASGASGPGSGRSSPEVSQVAISKALSSGGFSPMSAALHAKQQLGLLPQGSASPGALDAAVAAASDAAGFAASRENSISPGTSTLGGQVAARPGTGAASYVPQVSPRAAAGSAAAASTGQFNQPQQPQQHRIGAGVTFAAAVAKRDHLNSSFNDSDEF